MSLLWAEIRESQVPPQPSLWYEAFQVSISTHLLRLAGCLSRLHLLGTSLLKRCPSTSKGVMPFQLRPWPFPSTPTPIQNSQRARDGRRTDWELADSFTLCTQGPQFLVLSLLIITAATPNKYKKQAWTVYSFLQHIGTKSPGLLCSVLFFFLFFLGTWSSTASWTFIRHKKKQNNPNQQHENQITRGASRDFWQHFLMLKTLPTFSYFNRGFPWQDLSSE